MHLWPDQYRQYIIDFMKAPKDSPRPFFAVWKGRILPGSVCNHLIDFTEVLPAWVEISGGELPTDKRLDDIRENQYQPKLLARGKFTDK